MHIHFKSGASRYQSCRPTEIVHILVFIVTPNTKLYTVGCPSLRRLICICCCIVLLDQNGEKCDALPPFALNVGRDREQNNFQLHAPSIVPGAYSDEDSDDDRVILRRIIEAAEEATTPTQQPEIAQVPPAATDQPVTYNSTDDLGDTETEVSMTDDTDAETHAFHARGHDKGGVE